MIIFKNCYIDINNTDDNNQIKFKVNEKTLTCSQNFPNIQKIINQYANDTDDLPKIELFGHINEIENYHNEINKKLDSVKKFQNDLIENLIKNKVYFDYSIVLDQFNLLLNGYDIIIPDFLVSYFSQIADIFQLNELYNDIEDFKTELQDIANYDHFSEIEIIEKFENLLSTIDNNNFTEKASIIYSYYLYLGPDILYSIITYYNQLYGKKSEIYSKIIQFVKSKHHSFPDISYKRKINIWRTLDINKDTNIDLLSIIENDDVYKLQLKTSHPKFSFSDKYVNINQQNFIDQYLLKSICNLIECAAFYGSINCFKFLLLNSQLKSKNLAKYSIAGGNNEIIHICDQNKNDFKNTLPIAIYYHKNDVAQWIIENQKDEIFEDIIQCCLESESTLNKKF